MSDREFLHVVSKHGLYVGRCTRCKRFLAQSSDQELVERSFDGHECSELGWWAISGASLMSMLREVQQGGDPDLVYAEHYANSEVADA